MRVGSDRMRESLSSDVETAKLSFSEWVELTVALQGTRWSCKNAKYM